MIDLDNFDKHESANRENRRTSPSEEPVGTRRTVWVSLCMNEQMADSTCGNIYREKYFADIAIRGMFWDQDAIPMIVQKKDDGTWEIVSWG